MSQDASVPCKETYVDKLDLTMQALQVETCFYVGERGLFRLFSAGDMEFFALEVTFKEIEIAQMRSRL